MNNSRSHIDLPAEVVDRIRERREGLEEVVDDDGAFSERARQLLALVDEPEEVNAQPRR